MALSRNLANRDEISAFPDFFHTLPDPNNFQRHGHDGKFFDSWRSTTGPIGEVTEDSLLFHSDGELAIVESRRGVFGIGRAVWEATGLSWLDNES